MNHQLYIRIGNIMTRRMVVEAVIVVDDIGRQSYWHEMRWVVAVGGRWPYLITKIILKKLSTKHLQYIFIHSKYFSFQTNFTQHSSFFKHISLMPLKHSDFFSFIF